MLIHRRKFLASMGLLIAAPAVVRASSIMAVSSKVFVPAYEYDPTPIGVALNSARAGEHVYFTVDARHFLVRAGGIIGNTNVTTLPHAVVSGDIVSV